MTLWPKSMYTRVKSISIAVLPATQNVYCWTFVCVGYVFECAQLIINRLSYFIFSILYFYLLCLSHHLFLLPLLLPMMRIIWFLFYYLFFVRTAIFTADTQHDILHNQIRMVRLIWWFDRLAGHHLPHTNYRASSHFTGFILILICRQIIAHYVYIVKFSKTQIATAECKSKSMEEYLPRWCSWSASSYKITTIWAVEHTNFNRFAQLSEQIAKRQEFLYLFDLSYGVFSQLKSAYFFKLNSFQMEAPSLSFIFFFSLLHF